MPTAARLVAAALLAILGFYMAEQVKALLPEGMYTGKMSEVTAGLGLLTGWIVLGSRAGRGWTAGINNGITATVVLVFWALFVFGAYKMIIDALARRFRDPMEAFAEVFLKMYEYASYLADTNIILSLLIGAVVAGLLTEMAGRAWR